MLRHWKPLVTEFALAEALDRLVDEQDHHLGSCPKNRVHLRDLPLQLNLQHVEQPHDRPSCPSP